MPAEWFLNKLRLVARRAQPIACSDCFENTGVRYEAASLGKRSDSTCLRCGSVSGFKLDKGDVELLQDQFLPISAAMRLALNESFLIKGTSLASRAACSARTFQS